MYQGWGLRITGDHGVVRSSLTLSWAARQTLSGGLHLSSRIRSKLLAAFLLVVWIAGSSLAYSQTDATPKSGSDEYKGPSILSRDNTLIGERGGKLLDFRLYGSVSGVYDSGLSPVSTDQNGKLVSPGGNYGVELGFGANGSKQWRRDSVSLDYAGSYRHYSTNSYFDGTDQYLNLRYGRVLSRRWTLDVKETAGITSLSNGAFSYLPLTTSDLVAVPANELFDNKSYYAQTRATAIWQKTARLSFSFGGDSYLIRRHSHALAGLTGYGGHADVAYRVTRRQTLNLSYYYSDYNQQRVFGYGKVQTATLGYSIGLGRRYDFATSFGGSYVDTRGLQTVDVDPAIVAIIGQATVIANYHRYTTVPYFQARFVRRFSQSSLEVDGATGVTPGNGVYLTSRQTTAGLGYSLAGRRKWTLGAKFNYSELSTLGQTLGKYMGYQGGVGGTYKLNNLMSMQLRYDYRHYSTQNDFFQKDSHRITLGFAFSSGDRPLSIW